jgi:hypothetical protein
MISVPPAYGDGPRRSRKRSHDAAGIRTGSRHDEEVDRDDLPDVVLEEGAPGGGGRLAVTDHVLLDGRLRNLDSEPSQLADDPRCSPE